MIFVVNCQLSIVNCFFYGFLIERTLRYAYTALLANVASKGVQADGNILRVYLKPG
jgi:hypothetical protein